MTGKGTTRRDEPYGIFSVIYLFFGLGALQGTQLTELPYRVQAGHWGRLLKGVRIPDELEEKMPCESWQILMQGSLPPTPD